MVFKCESQVTIIVINVDSFRQKLTLGPPPPLLVSSVVFKLHLESKSHPLLVAVTRRAGGTPDFKWRG